MNYFAHVNVVRRLPLIVLLGAGLTIAATQAASAQVAPVSPPASLPAQPILKNRLAFKSQPDECFVAIGSTASILGRSSAQIENA